MYYIQICYSHDYIYCLYIYNLICKIEDLNYIKMFSRDSNNFDICKDVIDGKPQQQSAQLGNFKA